MDTKNLHPPPCDACPPARRRNRGTAPLAPRAGIGDRSLPGPTSYANPVIFIAIILLAFTAFLLMLIKFDIKKVIAAVIGISIFLTFVYIFMAIVYSADGRDRGGNIDGGMPFYLLLRSLH